MMTLYVLQCAIPLVLIALLAALPPRSVVSFWVQSLASIAVLVAISFVGIWTVPPWWTRYGFAVLLAAAIIFSCARHRATTRWPRGALGWLWLFGTAGIGLYAVNEAQVAFAGTLLPQGRAVDLGSPLGPGTYFVANGGAAPSVNAHATLLEQSVPGHRRYWGTAHGVDLVAIDHWGLRADGVMPADPRHYAIFGMPVIAPCAGQVLVAVDGFPDMQVPQVDRAHLAGNHVILRCADVDILLGHFRKGSVRVRAGQPLKTGDAIAEVGNSGNTSEPHLHIHAQMPGTATAPFSGAPIPIRIERRYLVRNSRFIVPDSGPRS
jgi:Peptidase family M23